MLVFYMLLKFIARRIRNVESIIYSKYLSNILFYRHLAGDVKPVKPFDFLC